MKYILTLKNGEKLPLTDENNETIFRLSSDPKNVGTWINKQYIDFRSIASIVEDYSRDTVKPSDAPQLQEPSHRYHRTPQENLAKMVSGIKQGILDAGGNPMKSEFFKAVLKKKNVEEVIAAFRQEKASKP